MIELINSNCLSYLKTQPDSIYDCIITSPPYNIGSKYSTYNDSLTYLDYLNTMTDIFKELNRTLKQNGHFFLQVGGTAKSPLTPHHILRKAILSKFILQNEIIWVKNISINKESYGHFKPLNSDKYLNHTHEYIYHLTKNLTDVNKLAVGVPFSDESNIKRFGHKKNLRCRGNCWFIPYDTVQSRDQKFNHPATYPKKLVEMCIKFSGIPENSLILDPFIGSGTTAVVAKELNMNCVGIDIDSNYIEIAKERLI